MSLLDHVEDIAFAGSIPVDQIVGTFTGSLLAPAAAAFSVTNTSITVATSIPEKTFFAGIFSIDSGTTWQDFNSQRPNMSVPAFVALQTQMMYGRITNTGNLVVTADNWSYYNGVSSSSSAYTFMYKVVLFARPGQGDITPQPVTQALNFSARYNYQKIFRDSTFSFSLPIATTTLVLTHNLGYIPKIRPFIDNFNYASSPTSLYDFGYFTSQFTLFQTSIDTTTIKYFFDNSSGVGTMTGTLYTRIYYRDN